ncbi:intersectin-1 isoform X3 [Aethina tumida]|uniref:intersectin-1 isoform X3 n=1 Tax=Aethina tumida TaxID=116153 RepID=UPI002149875D|nr:intersectin-1 isoform X3 [Aethina tumida]
MSAAGTPSTDPWLILARERARYEEQFKSLKPTNGIVTGEQAKGFFLQSQLPPLVLGQIWNLADTDSDGKMDINEFSIACKLINLKLRGFEIPKGLPPSLLASLQPAVLASATPPAIPPLPAMNGSAPARPQPPKVPPMVPPAPQTVASNLIGQQAPLASMTTGIIPPVGTVTPNVMGPIPTGIVPPMQSTIQPVAPMVSGISPLAPSTGINSTAPVGYVAPGMQPLAPAAPGLVNITQSFVPPTSVNVATAVPMVPGVAAVSAVSPPLSTGIPAPGPGATSTPRASVTSLDRTASIESPLVDWSVPHHIKLKYTQMFNTTDRTRSGYLSGAQARNVMVQTKLPQNLLAQIWSLSDMDGDGRLGCEEFVLAMYLCEQASTGTLPPTKLPLELIPPSFRKTRTASISSQGSGAPLDQDPASTLLQTSFEDKRKENFEKGQAELERRRKTLLDQQRKEAEERERKEREEIERREKARLEAERKRMEELEKQMREQQEQERLREEERKRQAEQREAARKEMERQRQLEWEKQRLQELQQQRHREQENVLKLKAKNQSLTIELSSLNEQVRELSQKICDTRVGVSNVKSTIDGMRSTRDTQMQEMSHLKNKLKEQNAKLLSLSQEKAKLDAKNKLNAQSGHDDEQSRVAFENKEITIKNLREKIEDMQNQIDGKLADIENNNSQLTDLRTQMTTLVEECEKLYGVYETKKTKVLEIKNVNKNVDYNASWPTNNDAWSNETTTDQPANEWPTDNWESTTTSAATIPGIVKYRALYEFVARNNDEISFQPGDIINVPVDQTGEPGWLAGELRGHTGWFPESYVEPVDGVGVRDNPTVTTTAAPITEPYVEDTESKRLEGIEEVPESFESTERKSTTAPEETATPTSAPVVAEPEGEPEYYIANYPYQSQEQGDLTFNAGDVIGVIKKEGDWWTGKIGTTIGIFPSNYVQKVDVIVKSKKPEIAQVIAPYQATSTEQLSLARGQLIMIRKKTDSGWWEGELQAKGRKRQVGWFPASYVKVLNSSGRASGRTTPVSTTRMQQEVVIDKVIALFPYNALNADELSFAKDDIISVTAREEEAWWRGELNGVSGLFPSNYVAPLQQQSITQEDKKRSESINEFINTERAYVKDMSVVHKVFERPLRESGIVKKREADEIFVNWQDILQCNKNFLKDLESRRNSNSTVIGDVICRHLPLMTAYVTFCGKQLDSAALLQNLIENNTAFKELIRKCQGDPATKGLPLSSFLIKPMQRITRYPLLITKIIENTSDNHEDYGYLKEALRLAEKFLQCVNENIRYKENQERLDWLQQYIQNDFRITFNGDTNKLGPRRLLHHGILTKVKSGKELLTFLFNDFIMMVQSSKSLGQFTFQRNNNVSYKVYKQPILITNLDFSRESTETVEHGTDSNRVIRLQDNKSKYKICLLASSVNDCNLWMKKIESARESFMKMNSMILRRPKSLMYIKTWLVVHLLTGCEIYPKRFSSKGTKKRKAKQHIDNIYTKVNLGNQEQQTELGKYVAANGNGAPNSESVLVWNSSMQFQVRDVNREFVAFTVYEYNQFSPDEFLGRAELKVIDIYNETQNINGPITKKLILHQVESGEISVKLDFHIFKNY